MSQGNWMVDGMEEEDCPKCSGRGKVGKYNEWDDVTTWATCDRCGGGGVIQK